MAYTPNRGNLEAIARAHPAGAVNQELLREIESLRTRLAQLERRTGAQAVGTRQGAPIAPAPPRSRLSVTAKLASKVFLVNVTNPEFSSPHSAANRSRTPIYHRLRYSTEQDFSKNVVALQPSTQTYFPVHEDPATPLHFELQSSYDGVHWSLPTLKGPVSS